MGYFSAILIFFACGTAWAQQPTPETSETVALPNEGISLEGFLEPFIYDPKGRRDPFQPYVDVPQLQEGGLAGPLLPLQQYDVDQLKLIGIIWDVADPKAMFVDPKGQVHVVRRDERIGRKNGYIAVIREGEVVVVEAVNVRGDFMYSTRVLKIAGKDSGIGTGP